MTTLALFTALYAVDQLTGASRKFGDWFTAERGTGPGKCGWV